MSIKGYILWLWRAAEGVRGRIFLQAAVGIVHVVFSLMYVWTSKQLIDIATSRIDGNIYLFVAAMVGCIIVQILLSTFVSRKEIESELDMKNHLRHRLFSHIMDSRWAEGGRMHTGDVMNRIWEDVDTIANTICVVVPQSIVTCIQFVAAVTFLALLDYRLAIAVVFILPSFMLLSRVYARRIRNYNKQIRDIDSRVQAHIQESMHHRTLLYSMEYTPCVVEDLQTMQSDLREKVMRSTDFTLFSRKMMQMGFSAGYLSAFVWGAFRLQAGAGYGLMTAFMQLAGQVQRPIMELSRQLPSFIHVTTSVDRLAELADLPIVERGAVRLDGGVGIRMRGVSFSYRDSEQVLDEFTYDFAAGRMTAILGYTGAGKSTLLRIILGLIAPQRGEATIYNAEQEVPLSSVTRCNLAYVPQGNSLMSGTVRSNLLLGNPKASEEQMWQALHIAVADFVRDLPQGLDTPCSESGGGLSEGQAQRIAIARALLRDRSVIIMDEPTAALDSATEELLLARLAEYARARTMIIVTHHATAAELCDAVLEIA